uniref:Uncharacterized protein n=1 Tax=Rhizophora mucronata TaxID=61149 RepID=A0A2P2K2T5_RHIMU
MIFLVPLPRNQTEQRIMKSIYFPLI